MSAVVVVQGKFEVVQGDEISPYKSGCCYLWLFRREIWAEIYAELGEWPSVTRVMNLPVDKFRSPDDLEECSVRFSGDDVAHIVIVANKNPKDATVLELFCYAAAKGRWRKGSMGATVGRDDDVFVDHSVRAMNESGLLRRCIGGIVEPIRPVVMNEESINVYNRALVAYYAALEASEHARKLESGFPLVSQRGPNFARNNANRARKRMAREMSLEKSEGGYFSGVSGDLKERLVDSRAKAMVLENERRILEETKRIKQLRSPFSIAQDALRTVQVAERCKKLSSSSNVAAWAQGVSEVEAVKFASSIVKPEFSSFANVAAERKARVRAEALKFDREPINEVEQVAINTGVLTKPGLLDARVKAGRPLQFVDFFRRNAPFKLTTHQRRRLHVAAGEDDEEAMY